MRLTRRGLLIGAAAALYILGLGRIVGISGVVGGVLQGASSGSLKGQGTRIALAAGVLVGVGTRMGGGCTSGHGVCGMARFSVRSLVATGTFLGVAIATTYVLRHVAGVSA